MEHRGVPLGAMSISGPSSWAGVARIAVQYSRYGAKAFSPQASSLISLRFKVQAWKMAPRVIFDGSKTS